VALPHPRARHSTLDAALDYVRRPPAFFGPRARGGGMGVMRDVEAARALSQEAMGAQEWGLRAGAETGRHGDARNFYVTSAMARAQLLQGMAAGADSRAVAGEGVGAGVATEGVGEGGDPYAALTAASGPEEPAGGFGGLGGYGPEPGTGAGVGAGAGAGAGAAVGAGEGGEASRVLAVSG
jgi:hypothetical protein